MPNMQSTPNILYAICPICPNQPINRLDLILALNHLGPWMSGPVHPKSHLGLSHMGQFHLGPSRLAHLTWAKCSWTPLTLGNLPML